MQQGVHPAAFHIRVGCQVEGCVKERMSIPFLRGAEQRIVPQRAPPAPRHIRVVGEVVRRVEQDGEVTRLRSVLQERPKPNQRETGQTVKSTSEHDLQAFGCVTTSTILCLRAAPDKPQGLFISKTSNSPRDWDASRVPCSSA